MAGTGSFSRVVNADSTQITINGMAVWDGTEWSNIGNRMPQVVAYGSDGMLYAGGNMRDMEGLTVNRIAAWDGNDWHTFGNGFQDGIVIAIQPAGNSVYVGGSFTKAENGDGTVVGTSLIARWDKDEQRWASLGAGAYRRNVSYVDAIAVDAENVNVYPAGRIIEAGGMPSRYISRWVAEPPEYDAAYITFQLDARRLMRAGLYSSNYRFLVNISGGALAGRYMLYESGVDSILTVHVPQPVGVDAEYVFSMDLNQDGYEVNHDWITELDIAGGVARPLSVPSVQPVELPAVLFDNLPLASFDTGFEAQWLRSFQPGSSGFITMGNTKIRLQFQSLDRGTLVNTRWYVKDPGGSLPEGIQFIASNTFWSIQKTPQAASFTASIIFNYDMLTGIGNAEDLRLLYMEDGGSEWIVLPTSVDLNAQTLSVSGMNRFNGIWTVGSVSLENPLTPDPPGLVSNPRPLDGRLDVPVIPELSWDAALFAQRYDLFIWESSQPEPVNPFRSNISIPYFMITDGLLMNAEYFWRVVAKNLNGETAGPVWSFRTGRVPDLIVTDVQAPTQAFSGTDIQISWTVMNDGEGATSEPAWFDRIYISESTTFEGIGQGAITGRFRNLSALNPGESYTQTQSVNLPEGFQGTYYVYVNTNNDRAQEESDRSNNTTKSSPFEIALKPLADLQVTSIIAPETVFSGDSITVTWSVRNFGNGRTDVDRWFDSIFLSDTDELTMLFLGSQGLRIDDRFLVRHERNGILEPGEEYQVSATIKLPDDAIGSFYLFVYADISSSNSSERGNVYEHNQELNNWLGHSINAILTPPPDLVVSEVLVPQGTQSGNHTEIEWTVLNQGPGATRADVWQDVVYFSSVAELDTSSAIVLGSFRTEGILQNDSSYTRRGSVRIPDGADGDGYFFVRTDWRDDVFEYIYDNNNTGNNPVPVSITRAPYPDLQVSELALFSDDFTAGDMVMIRYKVDNKGNAPAQNWIDSLYVSSSPEWDHENAIPVDIFSNDRALAAGENYRPVVTINLPTDIDGTHYIYVVSDPAEMVFEYPGVENNVVRSSGITVQTYPPVDLTAEFDIIPANSVSGTTINVEYSVMNKGTGATISESWNEQIYLSTDPVLNIHEDILLTSVVHEGKIGGGEISTRRLSLKIPNGLDGEYYLIVWIDPDEYETDADPGNNIVVSPQPVMISLPPQVDLQVTAINSSETMFAGGEISVSWQVENKSEGITGGERWFDAVYLSKNSKLEKGERPVGVLERNGALQPGATYEGELTFSVPAHASGSNYVLVHTDSRNDIYEHLADGNNVSNRRVEVELALPSDLIVTGIVIPENAVPGETIEVQWMIQNIGENRAVGKIHEGVFILSNNELTGDDPLIGVLQRNIDLAPGESMQSVMKMDLSKTLAVDAQGIITEELPGVLPGEYYIGVRTNMTRGVRETNYANNSGISGSILDVSIEHYHLGSTVPLTLQHEQKKFYRFEIEQQADIRVQLTSNVNDAANEIFIARDRLPVAGVDYDFTSNTPFISNHELILPGVEEGVYYILINNNSLQSVGMQELTLSTDILGFSITSITPGIGGQGQVSSVIKGAGFRESTTFYLSDNGINITEGRLVKFNNTTDNRVVWILDDTPTGIYDLIAVNEDGNQTVYNHSFAVEVAKPLEVEVKEFTSELYRGGGDATVMVSFQNISNVDTPYLDIRIQSNHTGATKITTSNNFLKESDISQREEPVQDYFSDDNTNIIPLLATDLAPDEMVSVDITYKRIASKPLIYIVYGAAVDPESYLKRQIIMLETLRLAIIEQPNLVGFDDEIMSLMYNRIEFIKIFMEGYAEAGLLKDEHLLLLDELLSQEDGQLLLDELNTEYEKELTDNYYLNAREDPSAGFIYSDENGNGNGNENENGNGPVAGCGYKIECPPEARPEECEMYIDQKLRCGATPFTRGVRPINKIPGPPKYAGSLGESCSRAADVAFTDMKGDSHLTPNPRCRCKIVAIPCDPNDIIGPGGYGAEKWVGVQQTLPYTIRFENDPELATAPAQVVHIRHPLHPSADVRNFRLSSIGFGSFTFQSPENVSHYRTRLDLRDSLGVYVDLTAGIDVVNREAFWVFKTINPETGEQPINDPFAGFLPVNDSTGIGEGYVNYSIRAIENSGTGDEIHAAASIIFDTNAPIETPPIFNTIDADYPLSSLLIYPGQVDTTAYELRWVASDIGSGVRDVAIFAAEGDGPFEKIEDGLTEEAIIFIGKPDVDYGFISIATDNAGNREPMKSAPDAVTNIEIEETEDDWLPQSFTLYQNYPNPFNPSTTVLFDLPQSADVDLLVYNTLGQRVMLVRKGELAPGRYHEVINFNRFASGVYFYEIRARESGRLVFNSVRKLIFVK
jgi:hypothetical protein